MQSKIKEIALLVTIFFAGYLITHQFFSNMASQPTVLHGNFSDIIGESKLVLYSIEGCTACKSAKKFLGKYKLMFDSRVISLKDDWPEELSKLNVFSVPVLIQENSISVGFTESTYKKELQI